MIEPDHPTLSIRRQCQLLDLSRSSYYRPPASASPLNLELMRLINQEYTCAPFYGYRRLTARLNQEHGYAVNHKRVARLRGFMYLVAVIDWFSRFVLAWQLSNTLDGAFCLAALRRALRDDRPDIFNTDQGMQFTAQAFTSELEATQVRVSMDGRGRFFDNIFIERLWRTVKYEAIYLKGYEPVPALVAGLSDYFQLYNFDRPHQSLV